MSCGFAASSTLTASLGRFGACRTLIWASELVLEPNTFKAEYEQSCDGDDRDCGDGDGDSRLFLRRRIGVVSETSEAATTAAWSDVAGEEGSLAVARDSRLRQAGESFARAFDRVKTSDKTCRRGQY